MLKKLNNAATISIQNVVDNPANSSKSTQNSNVHFLLPNSQVLAYNPFLECELDM